MSARTAFLTLVTTFTLGVSGFGAAASQKFLSPGKYWTVEVNTRDPGGVGAPQTVVQLYPTRQKVVTFQDNILIVEGQHTIAAEWAASGKALTITCHECDLTDAQVSVDEVDDVKITYKTD